MTPAQPKTIEEARAMVRQAVRILPRGGGTKPALSSTSEGVLPSPSEGVQPIDMTVLSGILEYQPGEFTFTALAGTRVSEVEQTLAEHGQYLPFDPLLVERGATLGGTVAANSSGPGRFHYGGVRDFLVGVRFIDSSGHLVRGGGKVVKNAAGFDLPKLMVGSLGTLGLLVELSFKVLPKPESFATLRLEFDDLTAALQAMQTASTARLDMDALDLVPEDGRYIVWVRLGGLQVALPTRLERLRQFLDRGEAIQGDEEAQLWRAARDLAWAPPGSSLVKAALTPGRIPRLEAFLNGRSVLRRYSCGGQMAWLASQAPLKELDEWFRLLQLNGTAFFGPPGWPRLGEFAGRPFYRRVKDALDPARRYGEV
jgi:glycolate oxidase FAD binding subunit